MKSRRSGLLAALFVTVLSVMLALPVTARASGPDFIDTERSWKLGEWSPYASGTLSIQTYHGGVEEYRYNEDRTEAYIRTWADMAAENPSLAEVTELRVPSTMRSGARSMAKNWRAAYLGSNTSYYTSSNLDEVAANAASEEYDSHNECMFRLVPSLRTLYLPKTIVGLGDYIFYSAPNLTDIYYGGSQEQWDAMVAEHDPYLPAGTTVHCNVAEANDLAYAYTECGDCTWPDKPNLTVWWGGEKLTEGVDFEIGSWKLADHGNVYTADLVATIQGIGAYSGQTEAKASCELVSLMGAKVTLEKAQYTYTGNAIKPNVTVTYEGRTLTKGVDYTLKYENNIQAGTARVVVIGKGGYTSETTTFFSIRKPQKVTATKSSINVTLGKTATAKATSDGNGAISYKSSDTKVVKVDATTGKLTPVKAGTATITATAAARGLYLSGKTTIKVTVVKKANTLVAKVKKTTVSCGYSKTKARVLANNVSVTKAVGTVTYANASTTTAAKKFKVAASTGKITIPKGTKKGTYTVKIKVKAKGNATYAAGTKTVSFKIKVK